MAVFYSDQVTNLRKSPLQFIKPAELAGRVRVARFTYTTPASGAPAVADTVAMTKVPANAVILFGSLVWGALSTGAGVAGADWGVANDDQGTSFAADFVAALNMDAAGFKLLDAVLDKIPSAAYTAEKYITAKVTGEAWAVSTKVQGMFLYVID